MSRIPRSNAVIAVLSLSVFLLTGCSTFYRNTEIRNNFNDTERKINELVTSIETFRSEQQAGYDYLSAQFGSTKEPFPQMFSSLQKITTTVDKLKTSRPVIADLRNKFEAIVASMPVGQNIQSNKPGWEEFKPVRAKYDELLKELNNSINEINDVQGDLRELENDHHIGKTNAAEMKNQVAALVSTIEQNKTTLQGRLSATDKEAIEQKQGEIKEMFDKLNAELGEKTEVWIMPGSTVSITFEGIRKKAEEVNKMLPR